MDEKKRVEEVFKDLCEAPTGCVKSDFTIRTLKETHTDLFIRTVAGHLVSLNYRKQIKSEWIFHKDGSATCKHCGTTQKGVWDMDNFQAYCGHCGSLMKED
jgi:hypothetical protein